jgi:hypothetical protein
MCSECSSHRDRVTQRRPRWHPGARAPLHQRRILSATAPCSYVPRPIPPSPSPESEPGCTAQSRASAIQLACAQCCTVVAEAQYMWCIASCAGFGCEHDDPDSPGTRRRPAVVQVQERGQSESHPRRSFSEQGRSWGREDSVAPRLVALTAASGRYPRLVRTGPSEPALGRTRSGLQAAAHGAAAAVARDAHGGSGCGVVGHVWAHPCHICTATWLAAATRALSLGSPLPHLHRN